MVIHNTESQNQLTVSESTASVLGRDLIEIWLKTDQNLVGFNAHYLTQIQYKYRCESSDAEV